MLSIVLLMLSISLATFVLQIRNQLLHHLERTIKPFDMVIGAKGSSLQLVLSSVLHIDNPTGNISLEKAMRIARNPMAKDIIPVSYGDNYKGIRILGTSKEYLTTYDASLQDGKLFEKPFEAVIGSSVAKKEELNVGDTFLSSHGLAKSALETHNDKPFIITGIVKPTYTIIDHLIITNLESIWEVHKHHDEPHHHEEEHHMEHVDAHSNPNDKHEEERQITSLLVKFRNPLGALQISRFINDKTTMQAAIPKFEIERLMGFLGIGFQTINGIATAILLVAGLSIFINLIKTVRERKQELALLRTYGANTFQLIKLVFLEALFLSFFGTAIGWFVGRISLWFLSIFTEDVYGYHFVFSLPTQKELIILVLVILTTLLAAISASLSLFKLNVSKIIFDA
ncbi:FtsX-like permease family protein [Aquimarina sp. U1-2]|uniref:ABC transporter permease n=1 Tax=Aquimarina sp. U1-2 TaxID=2823141 RepID=UPI001AECB52A|nr:FtsX-like permease family protein [Aquimarina sp. U1-2]MBP2830870.1 FtsX-like permease family protein [Aquimarina sp. U1-2]